MRFIPVVVMVLATGCMGQIGGTTPPGDDTGPDITAREAFDKVHPILARCTGNACHATDAMATSAIGKFQSANIDTEYTAINNASSIVATYSEVAPILTKIDSGHQGISYNAADRDAILDWLAAELAEATSDPTQPPPVDPAELLRNWSGCMTQANFDLAQMPQLFGAAQGGGQACRNCHGAGAFGFAVDTESLIYFQTITTSMSQLVKYFKVDAGAVVINLGAMDNAGSGSIAQHPLFTTENLSGMPALTQFYDLTKTALMAGGCLPPTAVNP
jgi:hypothetical protein